MRCIVCNTKNTLRDRTRHQGCCKKCEHRFAFEPTTQLQISDRTFADAIADVSANNMLFFTSKQLLYVFNRRLKRFGVPDLNEFNFWRLPLVSLTVIFGFFSWLEVSQVELRDSFEPLGLLTAIQVNLILAVFFTTFATPFLLAFQAIVIRYNPKTISQITEAQLNWMLQRWRIVGNAISKQLSEVITSTQLTINTDVSAYSFDRVIVCDRTEIAQLLIANNVHFEHSCAVLSIGGYPESIFDQVMQMLKRNPDLKVYALHDASPSGVELIDRLRDPAWFADLQIFDLGLSLRQALRKREIVSEQSAQQAQQLPESVRARLTPQQLAWLDRGYIVELESFTPQRILSAINLGIAKSQDSSGDLESFEAEAEYYSYTDSFG